MVVFKATFALTSLRLIDLFIDSNSLMSGNWLIDSWAKVENNFPLYEYRLKQN